jgi:hypothetical protein
MIFNWNIIHLTIAIISWNKNTKEYVFHYNVLVNYYLTTKTRTIKSIYLFHSTLSFNKLKNWSFLLSSNTHNVSLLKCKHSKFLEIIYSFFIDTDVSWTTKIVLVHRSLHWIYGKWILIVLLICFLLFADIIFLSTYIQGSILW